MNRALGALGLALSGVAGGCVEVTAFQPMAEPVDGLSESSADGGNADADPGRDADAAGDSADTPEPDLMACTLDCSAVAAPACWTVVENLTLCRCDLEAQGGEAPCDDGNACTVEDRCGGAGAGGCRGQQVDAQSWCDDGNACTLDNCLADTGCTHTDIDLLPCDDGDPCTAGESCLAGACGQGAYVCPPCDPVVDECEALYGDGDPCTGLMVCLAGACTLEPDSPVDCGPGPDPCTPLACDPSDGLCKPAPKPDFTPCVDGSSCSLADTCTQGFCLGTPSNAPGCACAQDIDCAPLDDGDLCNGVMICEEGLCLFDHASPVDCGESTPCVAVACEPSTGECVMTEADDDSPCDDGDACTLGDTCQGAECVGSPAPCEPASPCLTASCDPLAGCQQLPLPDGTACDTGNACVASAACFGGACVTEEALVCDDADPCTSDTCVAPGGCVFEGPDKPVCPSAGVCEVGVETLCVGGDYTCDLASVEGYFQIERCDGLDNDCDGDTDEACIATEGCALGTVTADYDGAMLACYTGLLLDGASACAEGWHLCTWTEVNAAATSSVPYGYWMAAAISVVDGVASAVDHTEGCLDLQGSCEGDHLIQAMSFPGVSPEGVPWATEAWDCNSGSGCAFPPIIGALCCPSSCLTDADCDDGQGCTTDSCDTASGSCVQTVEDPPDCLSQGVCAGAPLLCEEDGTVTCDYGALPAWQPAETLCDGLDNDCDGLTDFEDPDFLGQTGPPCELSSGVCAGATKPLSLCVGGTWQPCSAAEYGLWSAAFSFTESCDGLDNDCDGALDEGFSYGGAPIGTSCLGAGECGVGVVECAQGQSAATCSTNADGSASEASDELCDGLDNDCDGLVDDVPVSQAPCAVEGVCAEGGVVAICQGVDGWTCSYASVPGYEPDEASCDELDNDCDGATDEGFSVDLGAGPLFKGDKCGICTGAQITCLPDQSGVICSYPDGPELCDGFDNDCNGEIDEGLVYLDPLAGPLGKGEACEGLGECGPGTVECGQLQAITCSSNQDGSASEAALEICDGLDNDCDGLTDEGMTLLGLPLGAACDGLGACGVGVVECNAAGGVTCSTHPDGSVPEDQVETCNAVDDDCDGFVDEGLGAADSPCLLTGVCTPASVFAACLSGSWVCDYGAVPFYAAGGEAGLCDGLDNDCDGLTDEDFPTKGQPCDGPLDSDECASGTWACSASKSTLVCANDAPSAEVCDGADNDCDGEIDEGTALGCVPWWPDGDGDGFGTLGAAPVCACAADPDGLFTAPSPGDCDDTDPGRYPGAGELCNGVDDDCDGLTDGADGLDLLAADLQPCEETLGVCGGVTKPASACVGGAWEVCSGAVYAAALGPAYQPAGEIACDGLDNDCDGLVDALDPDVAASAPPCALSTGVCLGATIPLSACGVGGWGSCGTADYLAHSPAYEPGEELSCDGLDNDCDGLTDEPFVVKGALVGQPCDGEGSCGLGVVECRPDGTAAVCSTDPGGSASQAAPETCNGLDDDCDGATDNNIGVESSTCLQQGVCTLQSVIATCLFGVWQCDYSGVPGYEAGSELSCDGADNDCDGQTDEDFAYVGPGGQTLGLGEACGEVPCVGVLVCNAAGSGLTCSTDEGGTEICNGLDDDCDGDTDEDLFYEDPVEGALPLGAPCEGVGICGAGVVVCGAGGAATCSTHADGPDSEASAELCNGVDDDCDGETDEAFVWSGLQLGEPCDGTGTCTVGCALDGSAATCQADVEPAPPEVCDGVDNDCDGLTDEGLDVGDSTCLQTGVCLPALVVATCQGAAGWSCDYSGAPGYQEGDEIGLCDGLDNDCDGATDEDFPTLGDPCDGIDQDACALGTIGCAQGDVACLGDIPQVEICDGLDNDCDGVTDPPDAADCLTWYLDEDEDGWGVDGMTICTCQSKPPYTAPVGMDCNDKDPLMGGPEVCDGADNDCDGDKDEPDALGCIVFYYDGDSDGYGADDAASQCLCEKEGSFDATQIGDCCDKDPKAYPGSPDFQDSDTNCDTWDYDCDGAVTQQYTSQGSCTEPVDDLCVLVVGWTEPLVPACGVTAELIDACNDDCEPQDGDKKQRCK